jgi:hypothetical protein
MKSITIQNCKFAYRCKKRWHELLETKDESIRYCHECDSGVYYCVNDDELAMNVRKGHCVAFKRSSADRDSEIKEGYVEMLGNVRPDYLDRR